MEPQKPQKPQPKKKFFKKKPGAKQVKKKRWVKPKKPPFNPGKEWVKLTEKEQIRFRELTTKYTQVDINSLLYFYVNRRDALLLLTSCLDDTRAAGEKWMWFATGAVKTCSETVLKHLATGASLYSFLHSLTLKRLEKKKYTLTKRNTKRNTGKSQ